jgi:hypothetical protein
MTMSKNNGAELGPTGEHPRGADKQNRYFGRQGENSPALPPGENHFIVDEPLADDGEGELQFIVGTTQSGEVFLDFGTKVKWIAMEPGDAIELAKIIAANAQKGARVRQVLAQQKGADGKLIR